MNTKCQSATPATMGRLASTAITGAMFFACTVFAPAAWGAPNDRGDADGDGMSNYAEFNFGTNPDDPDTDHDSLLDFYEVHTHHTDPKNPDTDGDGLSDRFEIDSGSDPLVNESNQPQQVPPPPPECPNGGPNDCDGDRMFDEDERNGWNKCECATDPNKPDTDGDGADDGAENYKGTNPLDGNDN